MTDGVIPSAAEMFSLQDVLRQPGAAGGGAFTDIARAFIMAVGATIDEAPAYWSTARDEWLSKLPKRPGSDLLVGAISTIVAKISAANWYVEGPVSQATFYRDSLLYQSEWREGWDALVNKWVGPYCYRDMGGVVERQWASATDIGVRPALAFAHLDESKLTPTQDPRYPYIYTHKDGQKKIPQEAVMRIVDMHDPLDQYRHVGLCATSRAVTTALILMDIARYKRERLSDLPPAGILFINNMTDLQWSDIMNKYEARQTNEGNKVWRNMLTAFGYDPAYPMTVETVEFAKLIEGYDDRDATEIAVYSFAVAFRMDPRELWPVSSGMVGTATEADLQHRKAKSKGEGIIFSSIERQFNNPWSLPPTVRFKFDFRDDEDDMSAAKIAEVKIGNIRRMWEATPNASMYSAMRGRPGGPDEGDNNNPPPSAEPPTTDDSSRPVQGERADDADAPSKQFDFSGMISTEEARLLLAREGLIPPEFVGKALEQDKIYDIRSFGPRARVYRDGAVGLV